MGSLLMALVHLLVTVSEKWEVMRWTRRGVSSAARFS